jgi:CRP-like cAMP-binding protein
VEQRIAPGFAQNTIEKLFEFSPDAILVTDGQGVMRAAQEALRLNDLRLRSIVDSVGDYAIYMLDREPLLTPSSYPSNMVLFTETQPSLGIYVVLEGEVKLSINPSDGRRLAVRLESAMWKASRSSDERPFCFCRYRALSWRNARCAA